MSTTLTVVVWDEGDRAVRCVGPTSAQRIALLATRTKARASHAGAEIVPWEMRSASPAEVEEYAASQRAMWNDEPRRAGRPLEAEARRTSVVQIRMSPGEREEIEAAADAEGVGLSEYMRDAAIAMARRR